MMAGDSDKLKGAEPICVIKIGYRNLEAKEPHKKKKKLIIGLQKSSP